jgi:signal peptidase I
MSAAARRYFGCLLPLFLCVFGCGTMTMMGYAGQVLFQYMRVPDASMAPLLKPNKGVIVSNMSYWSDDPALDEVVTVESPQGRAIRRIVGTPGETIEVTAGRLVVDGEARDIGYEPHGEGADQDPITLSDDEYFVMADNRDAADSRIWGPIPKDRVVGQVIFISGADGRFDPIMVTPTPEASATP